MRRLGGAVAKTARTALVLAGLSLAPLAAAFAANPAHLNIGVAIEGIDLITDLTAQSGTATGSINLTWTEPAGNGRTLPLSYEIRASSSAGQISNDVDFSTHLPLASFSGAGIPAPGLGGGQAGFVLPDLTPGVTYFFAIREVDSGAPQLKGMWARDPARPWSAVNFAVAKFTPNAPNRVTDLVAVASGTSTSPFARLSWTAPRNTNGVPVERYVLRYSTVSVADMGGDADAWFETVNSTTVALGGALPPGGREGLDIADLESGKTFYFGIKSFDHQNEISPIDQKAAFVVVQARVLLQRSIELKVSTGSVSGSVGLRWIEPTVSVPNPPVEYVIKVSSLANIDDNAAFDAALPLSQFSPSAPPAPGLGGATVDLDVNGLVPGVTYYFAIRELDQSGPREGTNWVRIAASNINQSNFAPAHFIPRRPDAITDLTALAGPSEGEVTLSWTAPLNQNFVPMQSYDLRFAAYSAATLAGDTTAWYEAAIASRVVIAAQPAGSLVQTTLSGLFPLTTYYFGLRSSDARAEISLIDEDSASGLQISTRALNLAPPTPAGLSATAGINRVTLAWTDLTDAQKRPEFGFYKLYRSTEEATGFVQLTTTGAAGYLDEPLTPFVTYYFRLSAMETQPGGLESVLTSTIAALPYALPPQEPFGFRFSATSETVTFRWTPTVRFADGTPFLSTSTPSVDELLGYKVLRAVDICNPVYNVISTPTVAMSSYTAFTGGNNYFFEIKAFNSVGLSTASLIISSLGEQSYLLDDCSSRVTLNEEQARALLSERTGYPEDIMISRRRRPEDTGDGVLQSVEFLPMLGGTRKLEGFYLPEPARIVLGFKTQGGSPVPDAAPLGMASLRPAAAPAAAADMSHLGMYWHNGAEYKKMYGRVDTIGQTVEVQSPNLGLYQIRSLFRQNGTVFDLSNISSRVITPNNDGLNDVLIFTYDPGPRNVLPTGQIYDLSGRFVANMTPGLVPNTLTWDGRMNGTTATSGVYVYQIKGDGKTFNGTIVVAR